MKQVEFLEYIGRAANLKYINDKDTHLDIKIEWLLELIFPYYGYKVIHQHE